LTPYEYRAHIERKVIAAERLINEAIADVFHEHPSNTKAWWRDDEGIHHINFKDGIGFTVEVRLDHSPNIDPNEPTLREV
jgi:hypothetical protein